MYQLEVSAEATKLTSV